jgi:AcrR family transcriptional regulator
VQALVTRARSSVGAFYARFADKDSLLQHLHQRRSAEGIHTANEILARERWRTVPIDDVVRSIVTFMAHEYMEHAGFHREIVRRNSVDARFRERSSTVSAHVSRLIASVLEDHRQELKSLEALHAADMCHRILFSVLDQHVQFYDRAPGAIQLSRDQLIDEIVRAINGYLGVKDRL